jgi:hypothetical protein
MDEPLLTLSDAARRLEVPLDELTRAVVHRRIDFKLVDGIPSTETPAHITGNLRYLPPVPSATGRGQGPYRALRATRCAQARDRGQAAGTGRVHRSGRPGG